MAAGIQPQSTTTQLLLVRARAPGSCDIFVVLELCVPVRIASFVAVGPPIRPDDGRLAYTHLLYLHIIRLAHRHAANIDTYNANYTWHALHTLHTRHAIRT